jgi:cell division transport system permease protein
MNSWFMHHLHVLQFTMRRLRTTPVSSLLNILVIGVALSLPTGGYVLLQNIQDLSDKLVGAPQISIFLNMNVTQDDIAHMTKKLQQHDAISLVEFVSKDDALKQLQQNTGLTDVTAGLAQNPLPHAFIVYPKSKDILALEKLRDELKTWPKFEHVQLDSAWVRKLDAILKFSRLAVLILAVLLSFALVAITFNTIRLQILTQREEIEVSKLIGASNAFIRRPFMYFGLIQGLLGGTTAWLIITISLSLLNFSMADLTQLYASNFHLQHLSFNDSITLLGFSAYLGWLGALLSVSQHLWQIEAH